MGSNSSTGNQTKSGKKWKKIEKVEKIKILLKNDNRTKVNGLFARMMIAQNFCSIVEMPIVQQ